MMQAELSLAQSRLFYFRFELHDESDKYSAGNT